MSAELEKELLEILKDAIEKEKDAQKHYQRGASFSTHSEIQEMFLRLMEEEKKHERLLMRWYVEVKKKLGLKVIQEEEELAGEKST